MMKLPDEVPVMTLHNATLFPQALLPIYIFEPRYRQMLKDSLDSHRMFSVALRRTDRKRETPSPVAGLGVIRASVAHTDGTSHLILQGVARVELADAVTCKPYRVHRIKALQPPPWNGVIVDALQAKMRELLEERISEGMPFPFPGGKNPPAGFPPAVTGKEVLECLDRLEEPEHVVDLVSCALLPGARERQALLETVNVENRFKMLIHFLMAEIDSHRKDKGK